MLICLATRNTKDSPLSRQTSQGLLSAFASEEDAAIVCSGCSSGGTLHGHWPAGLDAEPEEPGDCPRWLWRRLLASWPAQPAGLAGDTDASGRTSCEELAGAGSSLRTRAMPPRPDDAGTVRAGGAARAAPGIVLVRATASERQAAAAPPSPSPRAPCQCQCEARGGQQPCLEAGHKAHPVPLAAWPARDKAPSHSGTVASDSEAPGGGDQPQTLKKLQVV
jgi:hypothetical protein